MDSAHVIELIREAFRETEHPGDVFLQGSREGCEPAEATAPFKGIAHWTQVDHALIDSNYTALSFFSEGGFRHFLPAFLIADLEGRLQTADPVFHLTNGFSDKGVVADRIWCLRETHGEVGFDESETLWGHDLARLCTDSTVDLH